MVQTREPASADSGRLARDSRASSVMFPCTRIVLHTGTAHSADESLLPRDTELYRKALRRARSAVGEYSKLVEDARDAHE